MSRLSWTEIVRTVFEIVSGLAALIFIYQYFQSADQPDRQRMFLLLGLVAVVVLLVFIGRGLLNWAISRARMAVRFVQQNALLVASLLLAGGLVCLLLQRTQDVVLAGATVGLVLTGTGIGVGAVRLLAMTRPSFLGLPARAEETKEAPAVPEGLWCYDFIEHLDDPTTIKDYSAGIFPIQVMRQAASMGEVKPAIFAHPGEHADTILTYQVENIPGHVRQVQLEFFTGILDIRRDEKTGQLQEVSQFHTVPGNRIRFEIWVNEGRVFEEERRAVGWSEFKQVRDLEPFNNRLVVSFRTDAMGNPQWNWAVWGEPRLLEVKPTSSAAG